MITRHNVEQGSGEWLELRCGLITGSRASDLLSKGSGATRAKYMRQLAGEIVTGEPMSTYINAAMQRGHELEPVAFDLYCDQTGREMVTTGFVTNDALDGCGFSPDAESPNGSHAIEIKSREAHVYIEHKLSGKVSRAAFAQIQFGYLICEYESYDYVMYSPGFPLWIKSVPKDNEIQEQLKTEILRFKFELNEMVQKVMQ